MLNGQYTPYGTFNGQSSYRKDIDPSCQLSTLYLWRYQRPRITTKVGVNYSNSSNTTNSIVEIVNASTKQYLLQSKILSPYTLSNNSINEQESYYEININMLISNTSININIVNQTELKAQIQNDLNQQYAGNVSVIHVTATDSASWMITADPPSATSIPPFYARCQTPGTNLAVDCGQGQWQVGPSMDSNVYTIYGSCPEWDCDTVQITSIGNGCDNAYDVKVGTNAWSNSAGSRYWFFDPYYFFWRCLDALDMTCTGMYYAATKIGWQDVSRGQTVNLEFTFPATPTPQPVECIGNTTPEPTTHPSVAPSNNPSKSPTNNPSKSPTNNPTQIPTQLPSQNPSEASSTLTSESPSKNPSKTPSKAPSKSPSKIPSKTPSSDPSKSPTDSPVLYTPTGSPSKFPSKAPSKASSLISTTIISTNNPTLKAPRETLTTNELVIKINANGQINQTNVINTIGKTLNVYLNTSFRLNVDNIESDDTSITITVVLDSEHGISSEMLEKQIKENLSENSNSNISYSVSIDSGEANIESKKESNFQLIMIILISLFAFIIISSYIHSNYMSINDFYSVAALVHASIHIIDSLSDVFFSYNITLQTEYGSTDVNVIFYASVIFIVVPILITMYQLHQAIKKWKRIDELSQWLSDNVQFLYIISVITGSSFAGVAVCTSNAFNLRQTNMPLNKTQSLQFQTKRMYSVVLVENIPQLALQIWFIFTISTETDEVVYGAMAFSVLSIFVSVLSMVSQREIVRSRNYVSIEFDVTGPAIITNLRQCRNQVRTLQMHIASLLGINKNLVEITRPKEIKKGLRLIINIHISNTRAIDMNIQKDLNNANNAGELAELIKASWNLSAIPLISTIKYVQHESKDRRENTVFIKTSSEKANNKQVAMSKLISQSEMYNDKDVDVNEGQSLPPKILSIVATPGSLDDEESDDECNQDKQTLGETAMYQNIGEQYHMNDMDVDVVEAINETKRVNYDGNSGDDMDIVNVINQTKGIENDMVIMGDDEVTKGMSIDNDK